MKWQVEEGATVPIFRPKKDQRSGPLAATIAEADVRELAEHWRLFYVAATRAEERLEIAGALGPKSGGVPAASSWYAVADAALAALGANEQQDDSRRRSFAGTRPEGPVALGSEQKNLARRMDLPPWAHQPAPIEARPPRPLSPSSLGDDNVADPPPSKEMRAAAERGRLIHALLERLPTVVANRRVEAASRWLAAVGRVENLGERNEILATVIAVLEDPRNASLFGPDSLGEAPISAVIPGGLVIAGTVDRLVVEPNRVRVVDFKTARRVPVSLEEIPVYHLRQMAAYSEALRVIFPGRAVEGALLYTAGPRWFELPEKLLVKHKPDFALTEQS